MRTPSLISLLLAGSLILHSCGEYPCGKAETVFGLVGFSDLESDSIIIRRFVKNSNFSSQLDTAILFPIRFRRVHDTLELVAFTGEAVLKSEYDYQLFFPRIPKLVSISKLEEEQRYGKKSGNKEYCMNRMISCQVNDQPRNIIDFNPVYIPR